MFEYAVEARREVTLNEASEPVLTRGLKGSLEFTVVGREDALTHVQVIWKGDAWQTPDAEPGTMDGMSLPMYASYEDDGRLAMIHAPKAMTIEARDRVTALLAETQFAVPSTGTETRWAIEELDSTGEYRASYRRTAERAVERAKVRYERRLVKDGLEPVRNARMYRPGGNVRFEVGEDGWPTLVKVGETLGVKGLELTVDYAGQMTATLMRTDVVDPPEMDWDRLKTLAVGNLEVDRKADRLAHSRARVAGAGYLEIAGQLRDVVAQHGYDSRNFPAAQSRMAALFRLDPNAAKRAGHEARTTDDSQYAKALTSSLGLAGTPEARNQLMGILEDGELDFQIRRTAAVSAALTENVTEDTLNRLADVPVDDEAYDNANLALGGAVQHADEGVDTSDTVETLIERYLAATSTSERVLYLEALGNTGDSRAMTVIVSALTDASTPVVVSAVGALRFMPGSEADQYVLAYMSHPFEDVRMAAVQASTSRTVGNMYTGWVLRLQTDSAADIRALSARLLGAVATDATVAAVLSTAAETDADATVRAAAEAAMIPDVDPHQ